MNARTFLTRTPVVAAALAVGLLAADPPRAQAQAERWLYVSTNPKESADQVPAASITNLLLRPNIQEAFYLYVRNPTGRDQKVTVVIATGPEGDEIARASVDVAAGKTVRVLPPKPEPLPAGAKPVPPPVTPLSDGLYLRRLDANGQMAEPPVLLPVRVQVPAQYVDPAARFEGEPGGASNRLLVTLEDRGRRQNRPFTGPSAKVRLDVSPARVPALIPQSVREGAFQSSLPAGGVVTLMAANLRFRPGVNPRGVFTVGVDGYERAFLFETDFSGTIPQPMTERMLRLAGPAYAIPGKPCPIRLEVDNPPSDDVGVEFGIDRSNTKMFETDRHDGDRMRKATVRWGWEGPDGGLLVATEAHDWVQMLDTAGLSGSRQLRLRLLDKAGLELAPPVYDTIVFDETSPEEIRFDELGKAIRNRMLDVAAYGVDPESKVARVLFFLGEPPAPDGKPAPGGRVVEGVPPEEEGAPYTGRILLPDRTGRIPIGVRFINNVGLARDVTDEIEVFDPPPKPTTGTIKVTVMQGPSTKPRPQEGATVELRDGMNKTVLKTGQANAKGEFTFEELAPGKYVIFSSRPMDFTKAQQLVTVTAGETTPVNLSLVR